ncbi:sce7726 family protein [Muricauda sp. SCSIO 64092]|uniref:sce7726 family protein n=1 Tax=Allomuricauda sp. SCSIO 64092 TaxID=2908842 RepID=UPI001FF5D944|nr:sce7726 family protein [Muricauda sp. SCSIO 64092]UOY08262.1 sce7726 family protein [Muricauda sp. SCSIO 64092]
MPKKTDISINQLRDYSSLFSRNVVSSWMKNDFQSIDLKIERYDRKWLNSSRATYLDYVKYVYKILESRYQNEYVFKNSFLNEWLIKEIGHNYSQVFSEFRVGDAIADLVMFNGTSKAFEIKTEMDSPKRLDFQLENYRKAFNEIYLILPKSKVNLYQQYDKEIGIIVFIQDADEKFQIHRKSMANKVVDKDTIMKILHTHEYKALVKEHYGSLPPMTSFKQFEVCRELIFEIPNAQLNSYFINFMKARQRGNTLSKRSYREFNQMSLAMKLSPRERKNLISQLKSPIQN